MRPLLLLGVLLIVAGIQLFTLGLVGEMIAATRQEVLGRRIAVDYVDYVVEGRAEDARRALPDAAVRR